MPTVFTITTTSDLPIWDGKVSLREAMVAANTNAPYFDAPAGSAIVPDFINFNIPGAGVHTIKPFTDLPKITDSLIINGYSQPGSSINTLSIGNNAKLLIELNGSMIAGGNHSGLDIGANISAVSGLVINSFNGDGILVEIAGPNAQINGNFIGVDPTGMIARPNDSGVSILGTNIQIGADGRNVISGNRRQGVYVSQNAVNAVVVDNYIGTNKNGTASIGNALGGIFDQGTNTIIGTIGKGNIISGNGFAAPDNAIRSGIFCNQPHTTIAVNRIGVGANGEALGNNGCGIYMASQSGGQIGGAGTAYGNIIAKNKGPGIVLTSSGVQVTQNNIFDNAGIGIDIAGDGVTANTSNAASNAPLIQKAYLTQVNKVGIVGRLNSAPNTTFRIEFFASGRNTHRDGNNYIGQTQVTTNASGIATFDIVLPNPATQGAFVTATAYNLTTHGTSEFSAPADFNGAKVYAVGAGPGGLPMIRVLNDGGTTRFTFNAYDAGFAGGVQVATGDVNGDGIEDIVTGAGPSGGPHVKVFDGKTGMLLSQFLAYDSGFTGGIFVAVGDINRDGFGDIITGTGVGGGPHVKVFSGLNNSLMQGFFAYDSAFRGGVRVASGDVNSDGYTDIVTTPGPGGGPHVKIYDGATGELSQQFFAYDAAFTGGVYVAIGDINGDDRADIITGAGAGTNPTVKVFDGRTAAQVRSFLAYDNAFTGGVRVASADMDNDGLADIVTSPGAGGGPHVKVIRAANNATLSSSLVFDPTFLGGIFVG